MAVDTELRERSRPALLAVGVVREFREKELLVQASAIAFRVLVAAIPATLFVIALLGAFQLDDLWRQEAAPELRRNVSGPLYAIIDDAVTRVLESRNTFWITAGAVLTVLAMASVVNAVMRTLNRIHGAEETRPFVKQLANAVAIGALSGILLLAAIAVVAVGPLGFAAIFDGGFLVSALSFAVRWVVAAGLLTLLVMLMVSMAPDMERPMRRVSAGAAITVGGWIAASLVFALYLEYVAEYGSILGNLATVYIVFQYVALSVIVYVGGLVIDALAVRGDPP